MKKIKNIEFIFLLAISVIILTLLALTIGLIISMRNFAKNNPDNHTGAEWAGLGGILLIFTIFYLAIFLIWQFRLWLTFNKTGNRSYFQLIIVFLFGIFPFINIILHYFLKEVAGIEHPFTEKIIEVFLWIIIFPLTGGK